MKLSSQYFSYVNLKSSITTRIIWAQIIGLQKLSNLTRGIGALMSCVMGLVIFIIFFLVLLLSDLELKHFKEM